MIAPPAGLPGSFFFFSSSVLAEGEGRPGEFIFSVLPIVFIFVIMYFLLIRPQKTREKERQALLSQLKKNDHVLTTGGIYGIVTSVKDDEVTLRVDETQNTRIRFAKSAIAAVVNPDGEKEKGEKGDKGDRGEKAEGAEKEREKKK